MKEGGCVADKELPDCCPFIMVLRHVSCNPCMVTTPKKLGFDACQFCGKEFDREETLAIHIQYEHLDDVSKDE